MRNLGKIDLDPYFVCTNSKKQLSKDIIKIVKQNIYFGSNIVIDFNPKNLRNRIGSSLG